MRTLARICVFCGSSPGRHPEYVEQAQALGALLAREHIGLVFGGGKVGLMGVIADAVLAKGGEVIGVIPKQLEAREVAHLDLTTLHVVDSMHARKAKMSELSDAFIAMPGGLGTFEELCEVATWAMLGIFDKPIGILNVGGYYDPLLAQLSRAVDDGFLRPESRALIVDHAAPSGLLSALRAMPESNMEKWLTKRDR